MRICNTLEAITGTANFHGEDRENKSDIAKYKQVIFTLFLNK